MNLLLIFLLALIPALIWLIFFWIRSKQDEPRRWILWAFLSGAVALLPVLGFSKIWQIFTGLEWIFWIEQFAAQGLVISFFSILFLAMVEEYFKHRAVLAVGSEVKIRFNAVSDGLLYSVTAAIGFSFLENAVYLWTLFSAQEIFTSDFWVVYIFRGLGTMLGHIVFSGVFGYFWGLAVLVEREENELFIQDERLKMRRFLHVFFGADKAERKSIFEKIVETLSFHTLRCFTGKKKVSKGTLSSVTLVAEGFWLATLLHTIFNFLVAFEWKGHNLTFMAVPFLTLGLIFILQKLSGLQRVVLKQKMPKR